jgi:hypothetical protein
MEAWVPLVLVVLIGVLPLHRLVENRWAWNGEVSSLRVLWLHSDRRVARCVAQYKWSDIVKCCCGAPAPSAAAGASAAAASAHWARPMSSTRIDYEAFSSRLIARAKGAFALFTLYLLALPY